MSLNLEWEGPVESRGASSVFHYWSSTCGNFRVARVADCSGEGTYFGAEVKLNGSWAFVERDPLSHGHYPKKYAFLEGALKSVELYYARTRKITFPTSNRESIVREAHEKSLAVGEIIQEKGRKKA